MIKAFHLYQIFEKNLYALKDISLEIEKGEFVFLVGPSGAGKTTLIKLFYGDLIPTKGQIIVYGRNMVRLPGKEMPYLRRQVGVVFQDFKLLYDRTVFDNIAFVLEAIGKDERRIAEIITGVLKVVNLSSKRDVMPHFLSGGEQQRVAIARAIVNDPVLILADEPTGNLDKKVSEDILNIFLQLNKKGTTVIMATHDEDIVKKLRKRMIKIEEGRIIEDTGKTE
ncbi:MAG TPA: cell division ATP-binding protein FtsE [Firmicutes bacterium]|nr:cell division ATP-binding protein FtsE [Bacillota bacterium]